MIIDSHTHIGPFGEQLGKTADELIKSMDEAHIDFSLVLATDFTGNKGVSTDELITLTKHYDRLGVVGNVDYTDYDETQYNNLVNFAKHRSIVGVKLYPGYESFYPLNEKLLPLYAKLQEYQTPVIFHSGHVLAENGGLLKYAHPLHIDELAVAFPKLPIIIAHMGNPWIPDCAAVVLKNKNVYADLSAQFTELQAVSDEDLADFKDNLKTFKSVAGGLNKCLFATDWYFYSQKECLDALLDFPLSKEEQEAILWRNAKELFKI